MLKGVLRGEFTALSNYIKKKENRKRINNQLKDRSQEFPEKRKETESKPSRQRETIKVKT